MDVRGGIPSKCLDALKFTCYSADEIRKLSVKEVTNPRSLDFLLNPCENGLYDPVFGPPTRLDDCKTCGLGSFRCPGHLGHIELPLPVYQPAFFKTLLYLLKGSCLKCHRILMNRQKLLLLLYKIRALNHGLYQLVNDLDQKFQMAIADASSEVPEALGTLSIDDELKKMYFDAIQADNKDPQDDTFFSKNATELRRALVKDFIRLTSSKAKCEMCSSNRPAIRSEKNGKIFLVESKDKTKETTQHYLTPTITREHISKLWENDQAILECVFGAFHDAAFGNKSALDETSTIDSEHPDYECKKRSSAIDVLFLSVLPVPPSKYRPVMFVNGKQFENPQTAIYSKIILDCIILRTLMSNLDENEAMEETDATAGLKAGKTNMWNKGTDDVQLSQKSVDMLSAIPGKTKAEKLENCWDRLQGHVNSIYDSESSSGGNAQAENCPGIKQKLEKKDGLFRKHMMGKRVNYAARSVISPDPYIATHEIGVPLCFASKLTYPTPVTPWNVKKLRQCVINGPDVYPGATMVIQEDGFTTLLKADNPTQRQAIAKQLNAPQKDRKKRKQGLRGIKTVVRHMQNGDVMLVNRQPTLHKGSIMAHKVRVLPGEKTLRLHYANCKSYNADFDGDEMNAHFPQSELCRAEAFNLMSTNSQYLTTKDGKPLSGLIQDHMVAGVNLSIRGRYLTQEQYHQLSYNALMHIPRKIKLLPPTILKPQKLWTGKQVFSTILLNITPVGSPLLYMQGSSKIRSSDWECGHVTASNVGYREMCESEVIVRGSLLLCGVLDKNHYGASEYGLVHAMYELYGCRVSGELLTCLARLFTSFLQQYRGFTLGVEDILVTTEADDGRREVIKNTLCDGQKDVAGALGVKDLEDVKEISSKMQDAHISKITGGEDELAAVDHAMKRASNDVNDQIAKFCTGKGLNKIFPHNNLQLMVISGAKGGAVNCMQISCLLGQIELEGRRPPLMVSGRSVPSFLPYDLTLRAGGFISQRFLTGIRPQEYFYHCMAGREGLVDTAVKTSRSGYLQRCLIKHLEGLVLGYDLTVRDSDGSILQFLYGEDGLEIGKQSYLNLKQHKFLVDNFAAESKLLPKVETVEGSAVDTYQAEKMWRKYGRRMKRKRKMEKKMRRERGIFPERKSAFIEYMWENRELTKSQALAGWSSLDKEKKSELEEKLEIFHNPPPISCLLRPDLHLGSMSEKFRMELDKYLMENPDKLPEKEKKRNKLPTLDRIKTMLSLKYQRSLCQPGESVGLVAAQSIGEPSTQMTLNTFHFAGRGEMNVTLGIPRLREILMTASKHIKTPQVIVPVIPGMEKEAAKLQKKLTCVRLHQVLNKVNVQEHLEVTGGHRSRQCKITIRLLPEKQFKKDLALTRKAVLNYIEKTFISKLLTTINHQLKLRQDEELVFSQRGSRDASPGPEGDVHEDDLETQPAEDQTADGDDQEDEEDEAFDQDDAKKGKNKEDFEEEEEEAPENVENDDEADITSKTLDPSESAVESMRGMEFQQTLDENLSHDYHSRVAKVKQMGINQIRILNYDFDVEKTSWCQVVLDMPLKTAQVNIVSLVEQEARLCYVRHVKGIARCVIQGNPKSSEEVKIATEGINFYKLFEYPEILDLSRLQCNCVNSVQTTYGIEAAVRVIEREVANVFAVYGIQVNRRHLSLVADYMCFSGRYNAFNRPGMESCASPLQQMTFESTVTFLKDAALTGQWDNLQSPSARIVAGQVVKSGTGYFTVRIPLNSHVTVAS